MGDSRTCSQCDCATRVLNGRADEWVCANHPEYAGQLMLVAAPGVGEGQVAACCRSFCVRRERAEVAGLMVDQTTRFIRVNGGLFAVVDAADYEWLSQYTWHASGGMGGYARTSMGHKNVFMHRLIKNPPAERVVDHINGNHWDNRRRNLRTCTQGENVHNNRSLRGTSRFKGVCWHTRRRKWLAVIHLKGKRIEIGFFDDEVAAARAYDRKARELFGAFAYLNFPERGRIVRLSGKICAHSHVYGTLTVVTVRHRQDEGSCRCHPVNMPTTSVGMAPSHPGEERQTVRGTKPVTAIVERQTRRAARPLDERRSRCRALTWQQASTFSGSSVKATGPPRRSGKHALETLAGMV